MKSPAKMKEIYKHILGSSFSVILATETSWDESVKSGEVFGSGFNVFRSNRNFSEYGRKSGWGVLVALSTDFNSEIINTQNFKEFEQAWVKSHIAGETHLFASVYFPPDHAHKGMYENFLQCAEQILSQLSPPPRQLTTVLRARYTSFRKLVHT